MSPFIHILIAKNSRGIKNKNVKIQMPHQKSLGPFVESFARLYVLGRGQNKNDKTCKSVKVTRPGHVEHTVL